MAALILVALQNFPPDFLLEMPRSTATIPSLDQLERVQRLPLPTTSRKVDAMVEIDGLPDHWRSPQPAPKDASWHYSIINKVNRGFFSFLCLAGFGHPDLRRVWATAELEHFGEQDAWQLAARTIWERMNSMIVVVRPFSES